MQPKAAKTGSARWLAEIHADAVLPDDIQPCRSNDPPSGTAFVTGATGFLGRYTVKALLAQTTLKLICLIQADDLTAAQQRLWLALQTTGVDQASHKARITVICGSLEHDHFGLTPAAYRKLANQVDRIYHCAALVNWARSYRRLRRINVLGTLRIIRFACDSRRKSVLFISSIAVCYATDRTVTVNEQTDMLPHIAAMPLGYAQSKCVAESLLRQAAQRGLAVTILRPALISGHTQSGVSNTGDFVAALLEGCSKLGIAMDRDWLLDFVPVDDVAKVIASGNINKPEKPTDSGQAKIVHVLAPQPRSWREFILWLNLSGYPIQFLPTEQWLGQTFSNRKKLGERLYAYRRFFQGLPGATDQQRPFECYLENNQQLIDSRHSIKTLSDAGLHIRTLDTVLLQRYLKYFRQTGLLIPPVKKSFRHKDKIADTPDNTALLRILHNHYKVTDEDALTLSEHPIETGNGILNQLAAAQGGAAIGLRAYRVITDMNSHRDIVVKTKGSDQFIIDATVKMAALCESGLGRLFGQFRDELGLTGAQQRETVLYTLDNSILRKYSPHCLGAEHKPLNGLTTIVLEKIAGADKLYNHTEPGAWAERNIVTVIEGLAQIQSIDKTALAPLIESGLLLPERSTETMVTMAPLWQALAGFAAKQSDQAAKLLPLQQQAVRDIAHWWPTLLAQPQSFIHNDFNPRNLHLRKTDQLQVEPLCVYDWELAAFGAPQRDLAEFLCFTITPQHCNLTTVHSLIGRHRQSYAAATGQSISAYHWEQGFVLALQQFVITRLPMYALINRFRPQSFLRQLNHNAYWLMKQYQQENPP